MKSPDSSSPGVSNDAAVMKMVMNSISPLGDDDWTLLEPFIQSKSLAKDDYLLRPNLPCDSIGFVVQGVFRMYYIDTKGEEITTHFQLEHDFVVSYESYITRQPSIFYIQALEDSRILYFTRDAVETLFAKAHAWERFGRVIAEHVFVVSQRRFQSMMFQSAEERYLQLLEELPNVFQRVPQYYIAQYLGVKPPSLSRIRKKLTAS